MWSTYPASSALLIFFVVFFQLLLEHECKSRKWMRSWISQTRRKSEDLRTVDTVDPGDNWLVIHRCDCSSQVLRMAVFTHVLDIKCAGTRWIFVWMIPKPLQCCNQWYRIDSTRIENPVQIMPFKTWKQIVCISSVSLLPSEVRLPLERGPAAPYAWLTTLPFLVAHVWCLLLVLLIYMYFFLI